MANYFWMDCNVGIFWKTNLNVISYSSIQSSYKQPTKRNLLLSVVFKEKTRKKRMANYFWMDRRIDITLHCFAAASQQNGIVRKRVAANVPLQRTASSERRMRADRAFYTQCAWKEQMETSTRRMRWLWWEPSSVLHSKGDGYGSDVLPGECGDMVNRGDKSLLWEQNASEKASTHCHHHILKGKKKEPTCTVYQVHPVHVVVLRSVSVRSWHTLLATATRSLSSTISACTIQHHLTHQFTCDCTVELALPKHPNSRNSCLPCTLGAGFHDKAAPDEHPSSTVLPQGRSERCTGAWN